MYVVVSFLVP